MIRKSALISLLMLFGFSVFGQYTDRIEKGFVKYWIKGSPTAYILIDSICVTNFVVTGNSIFSGTLDPTITTTTAAGERGINLNITQSTNALTGTLDAIYARATGYGTNSSTGRVQGLEIGARLPDADGTKSVGEVVAGYFWADTKIGTVGTLRAVEASLDGGAGGAATLAVAFEAFNNSSGAQTTSIAYDVNEGSASGRKAYTYDMRMQLGETFDNATDGTIKATAAVIQHSLDVNDYWTVTQANNGGATFNSVSNGTAGFTFSDIITGANIPHALFIGADADAYGSAIPLTPSSWATAQGVGIYGDDNNAALTGYCEVMTVRMLTTVAVTSGDVSTTPLHTDLTLNANYRGTGGLSSIWGNTTIKASKTIDLAGSLGDVGGGTFGIDVNGILADSTHACGVSVGLGGSGTNGGSIAGFRIRAATGTVDWTHVLSIEDGDGSWVGMTATAASDAATIANGPSGTAGNPDYWMKIEIGEDTYVYPVWKL